MKLKTRLDYRARRHRRLRQKVFGTLERPRMCVRVTNKHIYVQFVDDAAASTLVAVSTCCKESAGKTNRAAAQKLGLQAASAAKAKGINTAVFDRGGHAYGGRLKTIADAARQAGIKL
ncbi:MAG: 50S ribosomal protein L18 [Lentisphaerae bacterium]|nr:50S ribosomal protein L18 [Lentisphaerota bacterium]